LFALCSKGFCWFFLTTAVIFTELANAYPSAMPDTDAAATPRLEWKTCEKQVEFDCATVKVPLDYGQPEGRSINLSAIRLKASGPNRRIGTLFFNPGGPGGPGTVNLPQWQKFIPEGLRQRFDIVSWDPRGIGESAAVQCFDSEDARSDFFGDLPVKAFPEGQAEVSRWLEKMAALAKPCRDSNGDLLDHVSTADSARDMELLRRAVGDDKLNYLGLSYGTFLGATYANLYPDRVRALVLDGNINPKAWFAQPDLSLSLRLDSDIGGKETLEQFLRLCGQAGKHGCEFSAGTPTATTEKWKALLDRLEKGPIHVPSDVIGEGVPAIDFNHALTITQMATKLSFVEPVDNPRQGWKFLAHMLEAIWQNRNTPGVKPVGESKQTGTGSHKYAGDEQGWAVQCVDSPNPKKPDFYVREAKIATARGGAIGPYWSWNDSPCLNWPGKAAAPYAGPWNRRTAAPILVVGNRFDPETIYSNSVAMTRQLAWARLLTVQGYGHTAMLNPSDCANEAETRYFLTGELPTEGTICPQNHQPFSSPNKHRLKASGFELRTESPDARRLRIW